ncbi:Nif3-like dinuclear metal center hexameric protein [Methanocaldococcus infernus]
MLAKEVIELIESKAPKELALNWDNVGLQVGRLEKEVSKLGVALDPSLKVIEKASNLGVDFLFTHHPLFFKPINRVDGLIYEKLSLIFKNDMVVYSAHTNLDISYLNDALSSLYNLKDVEPLLDNGLGRIGTFKGSFEELLNITEENLTKPVVVGSCEEEEFKVAVLSGKGLTEELIKICKEKGVRVFISGDLTHHAKILAEDLDICLVDATHYHTEVYGLRKFIEELNLNFITLDF